MKHKPATNLPWKAASAFVNNAPNIGVVTTGKWGAANIAQCSEQKNADYIAHAANAYPRLVAELEWAVQELGALANQGRASHSSMARGLALLREIGEES